MKCLFVLVSFLFISAISILFVSCSSKDELKNSKLSAYVGKDVLALLSDSSEIYVVAVEPDLNPKGYRIIGQQQLLSTGQKQQLQYLLLNDLGYQFEQHKRCPFIPHAAFILADEPSSIILVSTTCQQIKVISGEKSYLLDYDPMIKPLEPFMEALKSKTTN
jgi:hypothetical protein